jgi:hypothetical protein
MGKIEGVAHEQHHLVEPAALHPDATTAGQPVADRPLGLLGVDPVRPERQRAAGQLREQLLDAPVVAAVPHEDQAAIVEDHRRVPGDLDFEGLGLEGGIAREQPVVAVELDDQGTRPGRTDERGERLVLDHQRARVGEEVQRVGDQVVEVRGQDDVEPTIGAGHELGQHGVAERGRPPLAQRLDLPLPVVGRDEELVDQASVRGGRILRVVPGNRALQPPVVGPGRRVDLAQTGQPALADQGARGGDAGRDRAAGAQEEGEALLLVLVLEPEAPDELLDLHVPEPAVARRARGGGRRGAARPGDAIGTPGVPAHRGSILQCRPRAPSGRLSRGPAPAGRRRTGDTCGAPRSR